jgi:hypothetical protein
VSSTSALQPKAASNAAHMLRLVFSFPVALVCLLFPLTALTLRSRFSDPDMWWHLKMGEIIWTTHRIPTVDLFSYTARHHAWVPHEWLSQLTIYAAYRIGGYSGLMAWLCILSAILLVAGYVLCSVVSGNSKVAFLGVLTIWLFATVGFAVRPHMIGYVLLVVELLLLHLGRTRNARWFWGLPLLFALWVNCHGSFFIGMVIAVITYALSFIGFQAGSLISAKWDPARRRNLAWSLALSIAALFINPVGRSQIFYPIDTMLHQPVGLSQVQEWQPLQVTEPRALPLLLLLLCVFLLVMVRRSELQLQEPAFLAFRHLDSLESSTHVVSLWNLGCPRPVSDALGLMGKLRCRARSSFAECRLDFLISPRCGVGIPKPTCSRNAGRTGQSDESHHLFKDSSHLWANAE